MAIIKIKNPAIDLDAAEIPNLPASKITSGTLDNARISLDAAEIPNLDTAKITSGTLADARIPANALNSNVSVPNQSAFKNLIINGDMSIAQRATSTTSITSSGYHTLDRFRTLMVAGGTWTQSQSTTVPTGQGFAKSLKMDCTTADASLAADDYLIIRQQIEGQNLQYLKKGTSSAESLTASFWVKSNKTGTYIAELYDFDNTRHISQQYTISSADTWEKKTVTFPGDTTGAFGNDNNSSLAINFWLAAGSNYTSGGLDTAWTTVSGRAAHRANGQVNLADSTSNEFYITGVQLEAGTSASDFEFLPHDVNKNRCLRYFYNHIDVPTRGDDGGYFASGYLYSGSRLYFQIPFFVEMRANPTLSAASGTDYYTFYRDSAADGFNTILSTQLRKNYTMLRADDTHISGTAGQAGGIHTTSNSKVTFSAEL